MIDYIFFGFILKDTKEEPINSGMEGKSWWNDIMGDQVKM